MNGSSRGVDYFAPNNPDAPYFAIKIQDRMYDIDINFIESITVTRSVDTYGDFSFTMINVMDLNLENKLISLLTTNDDGQNMCIQYGWNKGPKSRWYSGKIMNYTPTFMPDGYTKFEIKGYLINSGEDVISQVKAYTGTSISNIVEQISEDMGWIIEEIEPSVPFVLPKPFTLSNVTAEEYIRTELEPKAINAKKEPFKFYLDSYDGADHVYFVSANKKIGTQKNFNFFINAGNYGSVLSWSPSYEGNVVSSLVMDSPIYDVDTNDLVIYGSEAKAASKGGASLTIYGSTSPDNMEALLANKWFNSHIGSLSATLEIIGDPTIHPMGHVNVLPFMHNGEIHFSGGTYMVNKVTDTISGTYQTTLELTMVGIEDGTKTMSLTEAVTYKGSE